MAREKVAYHHRPLSLRLDQQNPEMARACCDQKAVASDLQERARVAGRLAVDGGRRSPQDHAATARESKRMWPGMKSTDLVMDLHRRTVPANDPVVLRQAVRVGGVSLVLRR